MFVTQETHAKDADNTVSLEGELNQAVTKTQQMEQVVDTLKQSEQQIRIEKDMVIENLNKEIESLRKRQEQTMNEQVNFLEDENKKLVKVNYQISYIDNTSYIQYFSVERLFCFPWTSHPFSGYQSNRIKISCSQFEL